MSALNKLSLFALTLLITGAIDSIRNLPITAMFGSSLIFFSLFAGILFLIPSALVSAELTSNLTDKGGIYYWTRLAFGDKIGFLSIWLQWINNLIWLPTILSFIAGTAVYLIDPALAQNKYYLISAILVIFWSITLINLKGIETSAKFTSFCGIAGLILPMALIIVLSVLWVALGKPLQIHLTAASLLPDFKHMDNWVGLSAIVLSYCGMEIATVHVKDVNNPKKNFPRALALSTIIILATMMMGSLAIAFVLPYDQINLVNGTIQTFSYFLSAYHLSWMIPVMVVLLVVGSLGGIISWVVSPAKSLAQAAEQGFLPAFLNKQNSYGVHQNLLLIQAVLVSIFCLVYLLIPSVNGSYWFLNTLSTQLYMFMYVLMFASAAYLKYKLPAQKDTFVIPGGKWGTGFVCLLGFIGCIVTLIVGFIPPSNMNIGSKTVYEALFCGGMVAMILPVFFFYWYRAKAAKSLITPSLLAKPQAELM